LVLGRAHIWFSDERISDVRKSDDHDRRKKNDLAIVYRGHEVTFEVKSLQTLSVRQLEDGTYTGNFQCDASDS
jgi:penicillin-binding protein-related factor A (putative recombinase)